MSRTRAVVAVIVLSALGLAGCSDDDPEPKFSPPSSEAPTSSSTSAAPVLDDPSEAFRAWVDARNTAVRTGDTTDVRSLSADGCRTCENSISPIEKVYEDGGEYDTEGWIVDSSIVKERSETRAKVSAAVTYAAGETVPSAGADPVRYDVERHIMLIDMSMVDRTWLVSDIGYVS
ncbi:DUF6318 family protein [Nocardioides sp. YIM 152315]|uniref:DUF6318 family protein n=1 Tax=Nocardioides sp. YIM 152315 TaxID=3031760 RepID=UPI0023DC6CCC|nr:DUF6318 family protein [Nocardioides sp. YIM 152315]MDF1602764.1 DUF6318 family protein [Nocardioides sp. YIM 152315]